MHLGRIFKMSHITPNTMQTTCRSFTLQHTERDAHSTTGIYLNYTSTSLCLKGLKIIVMTEAAFYP